jgi:hypothetical protein
MNSMISQNTVPDYFVAQFPGGGQRGYATVKLLEWFEKTTGLPTHQIFPYVTTGSVGILIASALYLPHPEHLNSARMSARQLAKIFPDIAARTPQPAKFKNNNSREPFADAIEPFIGHGKLKDLLGTVFFSSHKIGGLAQSYVTKGKLVCPTTGKVSYEGDPETEILDIAFAGTSLPSLFQAYEGHIDMAFSDVPAADMVKIQRLFPHDKVGAFVRVGNFRGTNEKSRKHLRSSGYLAQAASFAINGATSDSAYSQTIRCANEIFHNMVYNLEYEIGADYVDPPMVKANIANDVQFKKIEIMSEKFILDNLPMLTALAKALKTSALNRMAQYPETAFGILPEIQEFPLCSIPTLSGDNQEKSYAVVLAAGRLTRGFSEVALYSLRSALDVANSEPVRDMAEQFKERVDRRFSRWGAILLPNSQYSKREIAQAVLSPPNQTHELL